MTADSATALPQAATRAEPLAAEVRLAQALLFIAPLLWTVNYLVARWAPGVIGPHALALGRWTVAALVLAAFCHRELAARRALIAAVVTGAVAYGFRIVGA